MNINKWTDKNCCYRPIGGGPAQKELRIPARGLQPAADVFGVQRRRCAGQNGGEHGQREQRRQRQQPQRRHPVHRHGAQSAVIGARPQPAGTAAEQHKQEIVIGLVVYHRSERSGAGFDVDGGDAASERGVQGPAPVARRGDQHQNAGDAERTEIAAVADGAVDGVAVDQSVAGYASAARGSHRRPR